MNNNYLEKNCLFQTNFTYESSYKPSCQMPTERSLTSSGKQNVIPCGAQMQTFISALNTKKYQLKQLIIEKQKYDSMTNDQTIILQSETIKQNYEVQKQIDLHRQNKRVLQQIQSMKREKLKNLEKMMSLKKSLESRFQQIVQTKKILFDLQQQGRLLEENIQQTNLQNHNLSIQNNELELMSQTLDNDTFQMRQAVRQNEVQKTTAQSALNMFKNRIQDALNQMRRQNKQSRSLNISMNQTRDKTNKRKSQKSQNDINSNELMIRNKQIEDINIKLRNDLQKCKGHLACVFKNNQLLENSIQEFTYTDQRVTKLINKNQLRNL